MILSGARLAYGYTAMVVHAFAHRGLLRQPAVRDALWRQIHFTGVRALPYVAVIALLFGAVVVTRAMALLGDDNEAVLKAIISDGIRELGPLLTAFIVIVRSSVAIAAEVALLRLRPDISAALWAEGDHEDEVVLPRVLGVAIGAALLEMCFQFVAIASALLVTAIRLDSTVESELDGFLLAATWTQVPLSLGKAALFGAGIGAISCWHGLQVGREIGDVPKAVAAACAGSLSYLIVVDVLAFALRFV
jgi:phospholipid/cholesterol/gamma-HCH transport system permease protein